MGEGGHGHTLSLRIFGSKKRLSSPRAGPLGGTNDNQDTLGVGTWSPIGYQNFVHFVQSDREKITFLDLILGVSRFAVFKSVGNFADNKIRRIFFLNKKNSGLYSNPMSLCRRV